MREDLINSAVQFLNDPAVASSTLAKRIEFLESKQLAPDEIEEALKRAQQPQSTTTQQHLAPPPPPSRILQPAPPVPERDWKDYFVMATVSVGVAYGLYEVARRYVLPMILPPTPPALEADKIALDQEFSRMEALVEQLTTDTSKVVEAEDQRTEAFNKFMVEAKDTISSIKTQSSERRQETKLALATVEQLKEQIPRSLKQYGEQQQQAIADLQAELKSLKQLVSNRVTTGGTSSVPPASAVPSSLPNMPTKSNGVKSAEKTEKTQDKAETDTKPVDDFIPTPAGATAAIPTAPKGMGIPAWQLAAQGKS